MLLYIILYHIISYYALSFASAIWCSAGVHDHELLAKHWVRLGASGLSSKALQKVVTAIQQTQVNGVSSPTPPSKPAPIAELRAPTVKTEPPESPKQSWQDILDFLKTREVSQQAANERFKQDQQYAEMNVEEASKCRKISFPEALAAVANFTVTKHNTVPMPQVHAQHTSALFEDAHDAITQ